MRIEAIRAWAQHILPPPGQSYIHTRSFHTWSSLRVVGASGGAAFPLPNLPASSLHKAMPCASSDTRPASVWRGREGLMMRYEGK